MTIQLMPGPDGKMRKVWLDFRPNDIPDNYQAELMDAGDQGDQANFRIGRASLQLWQAIESEQVDVPKMRFYKAVGSWAKCSGEHVRACMYVADYVPKAIVDTFDELAWSQFRALVPHCHREQAAYVEKIGAWKLHCEATGTRITSVDGLRGWLGEEDGGTQSYNRHYRGLVSRAEWMRSDMNTPHEVRVACDEFLNAVRRFAETPGMAEWNPDSIL